MPPSDTGAGTGSLVGHDLAALGIPTLAAYVDAYVARTGLDPRPHLPVYLAYNFFRLAAILQGIAGRVRDGTATSEHAAAKAPMVRPLAAKAWEFAREAGAHENLRARARRRRRARARPYRGARGARRVGVRPAAIAGTSIGALIGAAYAAGMSGRDIRRYVIALAHNRAEVMRRLHGARAPAPSPTCSRRLRPGRRCSTREKFCAQFLPDAVPEDFAALAIPLTVDRVRPLPPRGGGVLDRAAAAGARRLDRAAGPDAAGRDRRPACWSTAAPPIRCRSDSCWDTPTSSSRSTSPASRPRTGATCPSPGSASSPPCW